MTSKIEKTFATLSSDQARFWAFGAFIAIIFLMGGSSRDDVQSLVILRPLAFLFAAYALCCKGDWQGRKFPLYILLAFAILMILQLAPLPPSIWAELPGRAIFADIANLANIEQPWRPLSLSPSRTLNSLFALIVPITAAMLFLNLDPDNRKRATTVILVMIMISVVWALLQLSGPSRGPLYLYRSTNHGAPVGLLANRNHHAVLLSTGIVMLGWYAASRPHSAHLAALKFYGSIAAIFVLIMMIFIAGSRAGLILMLPAIAAAMFFTMVGPYLNGKNESSRNSQKTNETHLRRVILWSGILAITALSISAIFFSRSLAFDRLFGGGDINELRAQLIPVFMEILKTYSPWGTGFGSFEYIYKIHEPPELLSPNYLNQAHNDWLQLPIEGGLPAILLVAIAFGWFVKKYIALASGWSKSGAQKLEMLMAAIIMTIFIASAAVDYALHLPVILSIFAVMACILADKLEKPTRAAQAQTVRR